jgi:hypothetical protein
MGFNLSGLAINRNFEKDFDKLQEELGWNLERQSEINFETASSNWKDDGICDAYFSERGTLLFISMDRCAESWPLKNYNTLTFVLSEISMAFSVNYCAHGILKRSIMEVEGERLQDEGERLEVEDRSEDTSELIWNQIEVVTGKRFWDIENDERAVRYLFSKANPIKMGPPRNERDRTEAVGKSSSDVSASLVDTKKWWQFWK